MVSRLIATLAIAAVPITALAQPPAPGAGITGIAHVAYRVSDLDREIAFLGRLGYQQSFAITGNGGKVLEVFVKVNDRQFIELYPQADPPQPLGWMHVCFEAGDLNALFNFLASNSLKPSAVHKAGAGNLISAMNDAEGSVVEFTQYMPGSRHTLDRGLHLGPNRVSTELIGYDLPVRELAAEDQFYVQLGFEAETAASSVHLTTPGAPNVHIALRPLNASSKPQLLLAVTDARQTEKQLKNAGVNAVRNGGLVIVHDPDGNAFIFLEAGPGSK
jgi:catechol 2,3-dioxygenase-like lactoylglutathione lyase family enzyme